jgi:hypothetical protein
MARQAKLLRARTQRDQPPDEDAILLRSAESIGRVIGTLQRQLDSARGQLASSRGNGNSGSPPNHKKHPKLEAGNTAVTRSTRGARASSVSRTSPTSKPDSASRLARTVTRGRTAAGPRGAKVKGGRKSR